MTEPITPEALTELDVKRERCAGIDVSEFFNSPYGRSAAIRLVNTYPAIRSLITSQQEEIERLKKRSQNLSCEVSVLEAFRKDDRAALSLVPELAADTELWAAMKRERDTAKARAQTAEAEIARLTAESESRRLTLLEKAEECRKEWTRAENAEAEIVRMKREVAIERAWKETFHGLADITVESLEKVAARAETAEAEVERLRDGIEIIKGFSESDEDGYYWLAEILAQASRLLNPSEPKKGTTSQ